MGVDTWLKYNNMFYVGQKIPFDLPVAVSTVTPQDGKPLTTAGLAENSFGQGIDFVTPLQMSLIDDAIANNGELMRPMLVTKIVDPNQTVVQSSGPQSLGQLVSMDTANQMRKAMYDVVRCGSGSLLAVRLSGSPWQIIGKTGTGEVGGGKPAQAWLITQAPFQNPQLTIVSMRENGGEGGNVNGPLVSDVYNQIFSNVLNLSPPPPLQPPFSSDTYCQDTGLLQ